MPRTGAHYYFSAQNVANGGQRHGNKNNWVTPLFRDRLLALCEDYYLEYPTAPKKCRITDTSLPWGGLLDVNSAVPWQNEHQLHRRGNDADLSFIEIPADRHTRFVQLCQANGLKCGKEGNHFHARLAGTW
jgi:hypothetical protein